MAIWRSQWKHSEQGKISYHGFARSSCHASKLEARIHGVSSSDEDPCCAISRRFHCQMVWAWGSLFVFRGFAGQASTCKAGIYAQPVTCCKEISPIQKVRSISGVSWHERGPRMIVILGSIRRKPHLIRETRGPPPRRTSVEGTLHYNWTIV